MSQNDSCQALAGELVGNVLLLSRVIEAPWVTAVRARSAWSAAWVTGMLPKTTLSPTARRAVRGFERTTVRRRFISSITHRLNVFIAQNSVIMEESWLRNRDWGASEEAAPSFFFFFLPFLQRRARLSSAAGGSPLPSCRTWLPHAEGWILSVQQQRKRHFVKMRETSTEPRRNREEKRGRKQEALAPLIFQKHHTHFYRVSFLLLASF